MRQFILILLLIFSTCVFSQVAELPNFTGLVEKHGAAVVNISTMQAPRESLNQIMPELPNIPDDSPFYEFFRRHMKPF